MIKNIKIVNFLIFVFSILIIINIFFGKYNFFSFKENEILITNINKEIKNLRLQNKDLNLLHDEFKKGNSDLEETIIKSELFYKEPKEKVIIVNENF